VHGIERRREESGAAARRECARRLLARLAPARRFGDPTFATAHLAQRIVDRVREICGLDDAGLWRRPASVDARRGVVRVAPFPLRLGHGAASILDYPWRTREVTS
jgi:hypothetical protein